jgi:hypothetical protein
MNLTREIPVTYLTVPLVVKGIYERADGSVGLPASFLLLHVLAGGVDIDPMLSNDDREELEGLALRVIEEGR